MFPIALDLTKIPVLLIGAGEAFDKRHAQLLEYGATELSLLRAKGGAESDPAHTVSLRHVPDIEEQRIIMIAGLSRPVSEKMAAEAKNLGKLVNVEDMNDLCDFYFTANVKRGDLLIAVSTGGASPTLARRVRDIIAKRFGVEWAARTAEIKEFRDTLKMQGKTIPEVLKASDEFLAEKGWME